MYTSQGLLEHTFWYVKTIFIIGVMSLHFSNSGIRFIDGSAVRIRKRTGRSWEERVNGWN